MKRIYLLLAVLFAASFAVTAQTPNTLRVQNYVPTGTCVLPNQLTMVTVNTGGSGAGLYQCIAGTWAYYNPFAGGTGTVTTSGSPTNSNFPLFTGSTIIGPSHASETGGVFTLTIPAAAPSFATTGTNNGSAAFLYTGTGASNLPSNGYSLTAARSISSPYYLDLGNPAPFSALPNFNVAGGVMTMTPSSLTDNGTTVNTTEPFRAAQLNACYTPAAAGAIDTLFATAAAAASAGTSGSCVNLGGENYTIITPMVEPEVAVGVTVYCVPGVTKINMIANNSGTPWDAMVLKQNTVAGSSSFIGCTWDTTNGTYSTGTTINANHVFDLQQWRGTQSGENNWVQNNVFLNGGRAIVAPVTAFSAPSSGAITFTSTNSFNPGDLVMGKNFTSSGYNGVQFLVTAASGSSFTATPSGTAWPYTKMTLTSAAAASGGNTVYTGSMPGGIFVGSTYTVADFDMAANNGTFTVVSATPNTLTLNNASGVADTPPTATIATATLATQNSGTEANAGMFKVSNDPGAILTGEPQSPAPIVTPSGGTPAAGTYSYACGYIGIPGIAGGGLTTQSETMGLNSFQTGGYTTLTTGALNQVNCGSNNGVTGGPATSINVYRTATNSALTLGLIGTITGASGTLNDTGQAANTSIQPKNRNSGGKFSHNYIYYSDQIYLPYTNGITTPVPPPTGFHGASSFADSNINVLTTKNASICPVRLESVRTEITQEHSFGTTTNVGYFPEYSTCEFNGNLHGDGYFDNPTISGALVQTPSTANPVIRDAWTYYAGYAFTQTTNLVTFGNTNPTGYTQKGGTQRGMSAASGNTTAYTFSGALASCPLNMDGIDGTSDATYCASTNTGSPVFTLTMPCGFDRFNDTGTFLAKICTGNTFLGEVVYTTPSSHVRLGTLNSSFVSQITFGETGTAGLGGMCATTGASCATDTATFDATHFYMQPSANATSGANAASFSLGFSANYWNGSVSTLCSWLASANPGSGTNPNVGLVWTNGCLGGSFQVPQFTDIGSAAFGSTGQLAISSSGNISGSAVDVNVSTAELGTLTRNIELGGGAAPTALVNAAVAGTGATCTISGKNTRFILFLTTGSLGTPTASGVLCTVTWGGSYTYANAPIVTFSNNLQSSIPSATVDVFPTTSTTGMTFNVGTTALGATTNFAWSFTVGSF